MEHDAEHAIAEARQVLDELAEFLRAVSDKVPQSSKTGLNNLAIQIERVATSAKSASSPGQKQPFTVCLETTKT